MRTLIIALAWMLLPASAGAHSTGGESRASGELFLVGLLLLFACWYAAGLWRVWQASSAGRSQHLKQAALFGSGWAVIAASLLSPLHALGGRSFTAHMIEHELLMLLAAPLIAWSRPLGILLWIFPRGGRQALGRVGHRRWFSHGWQALSSPLGASIVQAIALWLWHAPAFFNRALVSEGWHAAQHISLVFSALLFWWAMSRAADERKHGVAAFWLFFTSLHSGLLGALMSFAVSPWYARYVELGMAGTFGMTPLEDQQLAGLIMWIPGGAIHAAVALWYLHRWLRAPATATATYLCMLCVVGLAAWPMRSSADIVVVSDEQLNRLVILDGERMQVVRDVAVGARPRGMVASADGKTIYVAVSNDNRIDVVDVRSWKVTGHVPSGPDPEVIALHPDGRRIFVANENDSLVSVVDVDAARIISNTAIGPEPEGVAVSPDGRYAVATSESGSMAHFMRLSDLSHEPELIANVLVDTRPRNATFTHDSRHVWVTSELRGTVTVFDTASQKKTGVVDFENSDLTGDPIQAIGVQFTRDDRRAFVALGRGNQVAEVDPATLAITRAFPTGARVWNIALSGNGERLYAAAGLSGDVTVVDLQRNQVAGTVNVGGKPWGIIALPDAAR
jgi:PQQ-dependent catabolism-associated beta-propeller protein